LETEQSGLYRIKKDDMNELFPIYQSANSDDNDAIRKNFVVRKAEFDTIMEALRNKMYNDSLQHELILGRRGSGKSTLLKRIEVETLENGDLNKKYLPVNLAEEQAYIYRLFDLWEQVLQEICCRLKIEPELQEFSEFADEQEYTRYLYLQIHNICIKYQRKIVLLLDNFDRIVENFTDDGHLLREMLVNYNDMAFIVASTRMDEHFWRYDKPFYEFFRRHHLEALSREETVQLFNHWSEIMNEPRIKTFIAEHPGKLENIRLLTDGLPRTMHFFMKIILQSEEPAHVDFLKKIMDEVTPLYQERLNNLTAQMRKIVVEMAFIWEACSAGQLAEKCKMPSKLISANLKTLETKKIVDKIPTDKRNHLYRLSERFFNMWWIVTQGNPDQKRKARWLSIFLESWYDAKEIRDLAQQHILRLREHKLNRQEAIILSKALSLSREISIFDRDEIIELTELQLSTGNNQLIELPKTLKPDIEKINNHIEKGNFKEAHSLTDSIENEADGVKDFLKGKIFDLEKLYSKAEKHYLLAIEKGDNKALNNLAILYQTQGNTESAEKYYLLAIGKGNNKALFNLALLYKKQGNTESAEKYYLLAIEKGVNKALYNLALLYDNQGNAESAEKYYLLAIDKGVNDALFNLALLYHNQGNTESAEKHYLLAIEKGDNKALFNLAVLYYNQGNTESAEKYYLLAIEKGVKEALFNLALLYYSQNVNKEKAKQYITKYNGNNIHAIIIEIWVGIFNDVENRIVSALRENMENEAFFIQCLLVHHQKFLVYKLFTHPEFGEKLQAQYTVLYYVCLILNNKKEDNLMLKIPPELDSTVNDVLTKIKDMQKFYENEL
jgi:TPR repeat protein